MQKTADFTAFFALYSAVTRSPELTLAEKTAAIECAYDEYVTRITPHAYHAIAKRLAAMPPREHAQDRQAGDVAAEKPTAPAPARSAKGTFLPRSSR